MLFRSPAAAGKARLCPFAAAGDAAFCPTAAVAAAAAPAAPAPAPAPPTGRGPGTTPMNELRRWCIVAECSDAIAPIATLGERACRDRGDIAPAAAAEVFEGEGAAPGTDSVLPPLTGVPPRPDSAALGGGVLMPRFSIASDSGESSAGTATDARRRCCGVTLSVLPDGDEAAVEEGKRVAPGGDSVCALAACCN